MSIMIAAALAASMASPVEPMMQSRNTPRGSYARSCSEAYVNRGTLYADCRAPGGRTFATSLRLDRCGNNDIANINGRLTCGNHRGEIEREHGSGNGGRHDDRGGNRWDDNRGGPGGHGGHGGRGRSSITVYENANFRGMSRQFFDTDANLANTAFNDRISSVRVEGRWEVCTDAHFRGNCRILENDVASFGNTRFNDNISSLRPVDRNERPRR